MDTDGDLIISARNTCALYKLDRDTGEIVWQLGGKGGDFRMGKGTRFCFQHDARRAGRGRISLFDNSAGPPVLRRQSRGLVLGVDESDKRVRLVRQYEHPGGILAPNQGSTRVQPNGNVFVGWGAAPVFSEFSPGGRLLFDGRLTKGKGNYRAIREPLDGPAGHAAGGRRRAHPRRPRAGLRELERRDRGRALAGAGGDAVAAARRGVEGARRVRDRDRGAHRREPRRRARARRAGARARHVAGGAAAAVARGGGPR